ncbi:MAG TPA: ECF transporter S component [Anaerolinea sp.]|nr:ECF transporter S component [Anaerolinea sp.]
MPQDRTRKIVITGILGAIAIFLGVTRWGFIPWFGGVSLTIMHVPAIIGAILEGPVVGLMIGLIFGVFSMIQAAVAPNGPTDTWFTNPLLSVLPRLFIGPLAWLVWQALKKLPVIGLIVAGIAGSLTNTILVLGMIGVLGYAPFVALVPIVVANGLPEAAASAVLVLLVVAAWMRIQVGNKKGADLT